MHGNDSIHIKSKALVHKCADLAMWGCDNICTNRVRAQLEVSFHNENSMPDCMRRFLSDKMLYEMEYYSITKNIITKVFW